MTSKTTVSQADHTSPASPLVIQSVLDTVQAATSNGYQCVPADYIAGRYYPQVETGLPLVITNLTSLAVAPRIKRVLLNAYPADHPVSWVECLTTTPGLTQTVALENLEKTIVPVAAACLYVPPLPPRQSFSALQEIVAHLRSDEGCPWDRAQTLASMRQDLLSECVEVLEAIDAETNGNNSEHIAEELGDLMMAVVLMIQIATDEKRFRMSEAVHSIVTKLIRRHPHVFGNEVVEGIQTVLANWDAIKAQEKAASGRAPGHPLDGVPAGLPALEKARQLQSKAAKAGLLDRVALAQQASLQEAIASPVQNEQSLGELLWRLVALAHQFDINAEDALRAYAVQFRTLHSV
jgi:tetrapyrrole methylase family protein/MazG family protein